MPKETIDIDHHKFYCCLICVRKRVHLEIPHEGALHQIMRGGLFFTTYNGTRGIATLMGVGSGDQCSDHARKKSKEAIA